MTCKGICLKHKAKKKQKQDDIFPVKSVAKYAAFSSCGKDFFVHVVNTGFVQTQGMEGTS